MQAPFEMTEGLRRLEAIVAEFPPESPHWNEAQNRFHFIDRLLTDCLGWQHPDIEVERSEAGGRADYVLGRPPMAVLEAKREARQFDLPPAGKPHQVRKLQTLLEACKNVEEAVRQIVPYCAFLGAQVAIVCNGPQLIIFQALIPGGSPLKGECFVFDGLPAYKGEFPLLWNLLSPEGIAENRAYRILSLHRNPRIPPKASSAIPDPMQYRYRTPIQENLHSLASLLLEDLQEHPDVRGEFYKDCYVALEANNRHLLLSKNIISARYRRVSDTGVNPTDLGSGLRRDKESILDTDLVAAALGSRPVVVIGDVGVGKTSFFENLFEEMSAAERQNTYFIHVNLGLQATLATDLKQHVLDEIPRVLKISYGVDIYAADFVNAIYHAELRDFDQSVKGGLKEVSPEAYQRERIAFLSEKIERRDSHLHAALGHLAQGRNKQIILVIDNADQRSFETQQQAFLIAQELAASRNLLVFVSLRPSTFFVSKLTGALSGYQNRVFTIAPPPADEVIKRRIAFALRLAEGKIAPRALDHIRLDLRNIVLFLTATLRSIRSNKDIQIFLTNITGGNTRLVIELISGFCGSPNIDSQKIVEIEAREGDYQVPLHEFTKHALLGEYAYYNPQSSLVACNVFDISTADPREHFLCSLIISFLTSPQVGVKDNDGFVTGANVIHEMKTHGFLDDQARHALRRLATTRMIETPQAHYREIKVPDTDMPDDLHFRTTSIGVYHVRYWIGSFSYLDAVAIDTPIFDEARRKQIFALAASFQIKDRLSKAEAFKEYLEAQWNAANLHPPYFDLAECLSRQSATFEQVRRFVMGGLPRKRKTRP